MKKLSTKFAIALVCAFIVTTSVWAVVINGDFELASLANWPVTSFVNNGFGSAHGGGGANLSAIVGGPAVAPLSLSDSRTNGAVMYPAYGHYTARVNSENSYTGGGNGQNGNSITQTLAAYIDPADGQSHTRFAYAAVMVDPTTHTVDQKPYFRVRAINTSNGNDVLYDFHSYVGEPGKNWQNGQVFSSPEMWKFLNWNVIDLASTPGHPVNSGDLVTVEVTAAGCALGGHPGYVYVDEITDHEIAGPTVQASAPASVSSGGTITYTYDYHNGAAGSIDPTITAVQPAGVTFTSVSDPVNCALSGGTVTCNYAGVTSGSTGTFTVDGTVTVPSGSVLSNGNYNIAAAGFPTVSGGTTSTNVTGSSVTIDKASGQADPTNVGPVHFTAVFSGPVTGFTNSDVNLASSTVGGSLTANVTEVAPNNGTTYDVSVSGMTSSGNVVASLGANVVNGGNSASTSTDNSVSFDNVAPDTTITVSPTNPSASANASFSFTGSDPGGSGVAGFECSLDGAAFTACTSPVNYSGLSNGSHNFSVRGVDNAGNRDATPATYTWVVDTIAPDTTITSNPANPTNSSTGSFSFTGNDGGGSGVASFECSLDGGSFAPCTGPASYSGLSDGTHTFQVRAIDSAGNMDASPASYTWVVDTTAPDTTITGQPSNPSNSSGAGFTFTGSDPGGSGVASFQCSLDGAPFTACTSPANYTGLPDGSHTFAVRGIDAAGNVDATPGTYTWLVDTTPPDTAITSNPTNPTGSNAAAFTFTGSDGGSGVASYECKLDGGSFAPCTSPASYSGLSDGSHTFQVRAVDAAGNADTTPATFTWVVDTTPPDTAIVVHPANPSSSSVAAFNFMGTDPSGTGVASFECSLDGSPFTSCTSPTNFSGLGEGSHTFSVRTIDGTGNVDPTPATFTWVVDTIAPDTTITSNPSNPTASNSATFTFTGSDSGSGVAGFECNLDDQGWVTCNSAMVYGPLNSGSHTFLVRAKDAAGNVDPTPASYTWFVDTLAPTASATAPTVTTVGGTSYTFTVTYADNLAVNAATLGNNDVVVTGAGGFSAAATFTGANPAGNGSPIIATYTITPPGGTWDYFDNGTFNVNLQANSVADTVGNVAAAGTIGSFTVAIPSVSIAGNIKQYVAGGPNTNLAGVTVTLSGSSSSSTTSDANGNYSFGNLPYGGSFVVTPSMSGKVFDPIYRTYSSLSSNVASGSFVAYNDPNGIPRNLKVVDTFVTPGQPAILPVVLTSQGTESSLAFSVRYDPNPFSSTPTASCGDQAPGCSITFNNSTPGLLGVTVMLAAPLAVGPVEVVKVTLQSLPNNAYNTPITFGDSPTVRLMKNGNNEPLPWTNTDGMVVFAQGYEGDTAGRSTGDNQLAANDVTMIRQFVVGLLHPDLRFNELQRADTAPAATKGDGQLDATDIVETRRYVTGLDGATIAAGPGVAPEVVLTSSAQIDEKAEAEASGGRTMRVVSTAAQPGSRVSVNVEMDTQGNEVASSFTLKFDPAKLKNPVVTLGSGSWNDAVLTTNANNADGGELGVLIDATDVFTGRQLVTVTFDVARDARGGETPISFSDSLTRRGNSDAGGNRLPAKYESGSVNISGAASAGFEVAGLISTPDGRGLRNAQVTIVDQSGETRTVTTSAFGYYRFEDVAAGGTYTVRVASRQYRFIARTVTVSGSLADLDFVGQE